MEYAGTAFDKVLDELEKDNRPWVIELLNLVNNIKILAGFEPERAKVFLNQFVEQTKNNLKIKL